MPPETNEYLLGQMNAKLDQLFDLVRGSASNVERLTERVQKLEAWRWMLIGAAAAAGGAGSFLTKVLTSSGGTP